MTDPDLDLSPATLMRACKGNVAMLPRLMVHDDAGWRAGVVRTDSKGRVHMGRRTLNNVVAGQVPLKAGLWLGPGVQEFLIDLKPHHLQGSTEMTGGSNRAAARAVAKADRFGRFQDEGDYGHNPNRDHRQQDVAADVAEAKARGTSGSVRSTVFGRSGPSDK